MPTLELAISAVAMLTGATAATGALDRVGKSALANTRALYGFQRVLDRLGYSATGMGAALGRAFGAFGVYRGVRFGLETLGEFDKQIQVLRATLGDSVIESHFAALTQKAYEFGATTQFGAAQALDAMVEDRKSVV